MKTTFDGFIDLDKCPQCGWTGTWVFYDGCLGYESLRCPKCYLDVNDIKIAVKHNGGVKS